MSKGKSTGIDDITTEMLEVLGEFGIDTLTSICNEMYTTVYIPEDLKTSVFILLPKKQKAVECSDYRTISLMCHTLKLLLTVILKRVTNKIDIEVGCEQAGFRKNSGTKAVTAHLYWQQITLIRNGSDLTEPVKIKRGVRQVCVLSPVIFNLYCTQSTYSERQIISLG